MGTQDNQRANGARGERGEDSWRGKRCARRAIQGRVIGEIQLFYRDEGNEPTRQQVNKLLHEEGNIKI